MNSRIQIIPKGGAELDSYVDAVLRMEEELCRDDITVEEHRIKSVEAARVLLLKIIGTVASYYIIKIIDLLWRHEF